MEQRSIERIVIETGLRPCLFIGISDETLSIQVHVSGMKRVRDKGIKHVKECETYMKHVTHLMTQ